MPNPASLGNEILRKTSFLGCELGWKVPEQTPEDLCLTASSP